MNLIPRVIPTLLLDGERLVKTVNFKAPAYLGDPVNTVRVFNELEVDELIIIDITASLRSVPPNLELLTKLSAEAFMPLTYGGGIRSREEAGSVLRLGFEKIAVESLLISNPEEVRTMSEWFGSQAIVGVLTTKGSGVRASPLWGRTRQSLVDRLSSAEKAMVGEILHYNSTRDGTREGFDTELIGLISKNLSMPLIACGGAGGTRDLWLAIKAGASAVAAGSLFTQHGKRRATLLSYPNRDMLAELWQDERP